MRERVEMSILHRERMKQLVSFDGMIYGGTRRCRPTDIDLYMDIGGSKFVYADLKYGDVKVSIGQRKGLEAAVRSHISAGNHAVAFISRHGVSDPTTDIIARDSIVDEVYTTPSYFFKSNPLYNVLGHDFGYDQPEWFKLNFVDCNYYLGDVVEQYFHGNPLQNATTIQQQKGN